MDSRCESFADRVLQQRLPEIKTIDVHICKLRAKLAKAGATFCIETVWGVGYRMEETKKAA